MEKLRKIVLKMYFVPWKPEKKKHGDVDMIVICTYQPAFASPFELGPSFTFGSLLSKWEQKTAQANPPSSSKWQMS